MRKVFIHYEIDPKIRMESRIHKFMGEVENRGFDMLSYKEVTFENLSGYDLICVDHVALRFGMHIISRRMRIENNNIVRILGSMPNKKKVLLLHDLHEYSFYDGPGTVYRQGNLIYPFDSPRIGIDKLNELINKAGFQYLIMYYYCQERLNILQKCTSIKKSIVINPCTPINEFKDYGMKKDVDVLITGNLDARVYTFRDRVKNILTSEKAKKYNINTKIIPYSNRVEYGEKLSREYNRSYMCLSTVSNFSYLVFKYPEISASKSVLLGNINDQGKEVWGDDFVHIENNMTDEQILEKIRSALDDKEKLQNMANKMYDKIRSEYNYNKFCERLNNFFDNVLKDN